MIEALARLKPWVKAEIGLQLDDSDLEMSQLYLPENEYPNAAHATFIRNTSGRWFIAFDFRYNRTLAKQHFVRAREFFSTASVAAEQGYVAVCVDLLYSACELAVKAQLLSLPETKLAQKASHRGIAHHALRYSTSGAIAPSAPTALNKLQALRDRARYFKGSLDIPMEEIRSLMASVDGLIVSDTSEIPRE